MVCLLIEAFSLVGIILWHFLKSFIQIFFPPPRKDVRGEIIFLTGAGSGIGRMMALKFAKLGATIVCVDINQMANDSTVQEIKDQGLSAYGYKCDCSSREDIYRVAELVKNDVGDVTILINNAGIVSGKKFLETEDWMIQKTMEVNTMAHFWTNKAFLPSMLEKNHGHVVTIASSAGLFGVCGLCDYCASKTGAVGIDESLMMELNAMKMTGVHTTVICPFFINTGMFDGVKTRFPLLLPILEPNWATDKMVDAILRNQTMLLLPKILTLFLWIKCTVPTPTYHALAEFFGTNACMDDFKGRSKKSE
nr:epidermal retinol dehydrogenase 2-like [Pocillopora verrucosa]